MASVTDGYVQGAAGFYKASDGSGPYTINSSGVAVLIGQNDAAKENYTDNGGAYVSNTPRAAGRGILAIITTGGTATLTFGGVDIPFTFVVGPTILPLAITKTVLGTAVGAFYAIS